MAIIDKIQLSGTVYTIGNETTTAVTSASTDNEIPTAKAVYDAIPQGGGGGGKTISAGTNISITTGETADTINCTLPIETISNPYGVSQIYVGDNIYKNSNYEAIVIANKDDSSTGETRVEFAHGAISIGSSNKVFQNGIAIGHRAIAGASNSWNDIAIGVNVTASGSTKTNINNQIKVDDKNQIYIYNKDNTEMICLQDQLGGGGSSYTAGDGIDITNDVISVTGKVDTSTYNTYTAATDTALREKANTATTYTKTEVIKQITAITNPINSTLTAHTADTVIHVTSDEKAAWNNKQDVLVSGTNIKTINGETLLGEGNIEIQSGGGGSITVDQSLDSGSTNAVANSAITNAINSKMDEVNFASFYGNQYSAGLKGYYYDSQTETQTEKFNWGMVWQSDGSIGFDALGNLAVFNKLDTSAITTSVTSSSTDSQVPSAKAVNDKLGGLSLVKLTQSEYSEMEQAGTLDNSTLYIVIGS